jgi:methionyl-tRNA formyltransferase
MALRIIFMGTPDFSVPTLNALYKAGHDIVCCYTQPPRPAGRRGLELKPSPIQMAAEALGLEVRHPTSLKDAVEQERFAALDADVAVVVAYGLLLPEAILQAPKHGCFNGHASLLPRWRGAAPIQRAIMAGDEETGVMIMKMDVGLDTGPVALAGRTDITSKTTAGSLHDELSELGAELMVDAMAQLEAGQLQLVEQSAGGIEYASKISKAETRIDWTKSAKEVQRHIMGLSPFPGAWCEMELGGKTQRVKILEAETHSLSGDAGAVLSDDLVIACKTGSVRLTKLQKAGSKTMSSQEFLLGNSLSTGAQLV